MKCTVYIKTRAVARMWWTLYYHRGQNFSICTKKEYRQFYQKRYFFFLLQLLDYHFAHLPNNMSHHCKHSPYLGLQEKAGYVTCRNSSECLSGKSTAFEHWKPEFEASTLGNSFSYVTLNKPQNLSELQFPHLLYRSDSTYLTVLLEMKWSIW